MDSFSTIRSAIINAQRQGYHKLSISTKQGAGSTKIYSLLQILQREGYIESVSFLSTAIQQPKQTVCYSIILKYDSNGKPAIQRFFRISSSSRRVYIKAAALWQPQTTVGTLILSTSFGIRTDRSARRLNLGGEVLGGLR